MIRHELRVQLAGIAGWPNQNIYNVIQQLEDAMGEEAERSVQILNDALEQCKQRITTVSNQGEDAIRRSGDFVDEGDMVLTEPNVMNSVRKRGGEYVTIRMGKSNT